ncbi:hypothetical protein J5N97_025869 [Dioscorea zingiberensis]|uniref:Pentatricopeptide repeat-containing protein n=1 Tax=Dioscorea zingiberensis TaxID=325984 RepID=A0A9D5C129_9LILI|nr:hypothetical protein J5N97_025869 [Dioscorea zingiberensis]
MRHHGFRRRLLAIASHYQLGALRRLATSYSGRIVRADPAGLSLAVEVDPPDLTTDARGYDLPRRDLICRVSKILLSSSPTSDPLLELSDYLQTLKITLSSLEVSEILKSLRSPSKALDFFRYVAALPGFRHDCFTYNRILSILSKSGAEMDLVQKIIDEMERNGVRGSISTVNILIGMVGAAEIERCLELAKKWDLRFNGYTYKCLLQAYLRYRDVEAKADKIDEAYTVFRDMKRQALLFDDMLAAGCYPNIVTYNILLDCLEKYGRTAEAFKLYDTLRQQGLTPDSITYAVLERLEIRMMGSLAEGFGWKRNNQTCCSINYYDLLCI